MRNPQTTSTRVLTALGIAGEYCRKAICLSRKARPVRVTPKKKINIMANRRLDGDCRTCATPWKDTDFRKTIPNQAMTPEQIRQLADRGIPVSGQNLNAVYDSATAGWNLDPIFERGADICQLWETEKAAQRRVLAAKKRDVMRFR